MSHSRQSNVTRFAAWSVAGTALLAMLSTLAGCGQKFDESTAASTTVRTGDRDPAQELPDEKYECEGRNVTRSEGPYSLECEKIGKELRLSFENGGYVVTKITSSSVNDDTWTLETTHSEDDDDWEVEIVAPDVER